MTWFDIDGWLTIEEGQVLAVLAAGKDVLELGSYKGRSTVCMAQLAKHVTTIDTHAGDSHTGPTDTFEEFEANLKAHGVTDRVMYLIGDIERVCWGLSRTPDLVYVDDDHNRAKRSTEIALRVLRPGGTIAWHDWDYESVQTAVRSLGIEPTGFRGRLAWWTQPAT